MTDFYKNGFDDGYGRYRDHSDDNDPENDGDRYDYHKGSEDGRRRRRYSDELEDF